MSSRRFLHLVLGGLVVAGVLLVLADAFDESALAAVGAAVLLALLVLRAAFLHKRGQV